MDQELARKKFISLLQLAYSGELAAGYAYRGHKRSVKNLDERVKIQQIEDEEWHHRRLVGEMLQKLNAKPRKLRECRAFLIGRSLGLLCYISGWFFPMYGAGKLESRNVKEYELAAQLARESGRLEYVDCLLQMAEVEWDHERYFRSKVENHSWLRWFPLWDAPPPKETIRLNHARMLFNGP